MALFCSMAFGYVEAQQDTGKTEKPGTQPPAQNTPAAGKPAPTANKPPVDTTKAALEKKTKDSLAALQDVCDSCAKKAYDSCSTNTCKPGALAEGGSWWLVYTPLILFAILLIVLLSSIKDFDLKEALSENEYVKKTIVNPAYSDLAIKDIAGTAAAANISDVLPPTIEITDISTAANSLPTPGRISSSRFIAFVTSLITLILAVCLCSFFIYFYIATGRAPDISKFSAVLLALGIGVVPYAFNKVAAAIANKPVTNE